MITKYDGFQTAILWRHGAAGEVVLKFLSLEVGEHRVHLDMDWLSEMSCLASRLRRREDPQTAIRRDIARLHSQTRTNVSLSIVKPKTSKIDSHYKFEERQWSLINYFVQLSDLDFWKMAVMGINTPLPSSTYTTQKTRK